MERFRELEKEFKTKQFSKKALQNPGGNNFVTNSSRASDDEGSNYDEDQYDEYGGGSDDLKSEDEEI